MKFLALFVLFVLLFCARAAIPEDDRHGVHQAPSEEFINVSVDVEEVKEEAIEIIEDLWNRVTDVFDKRDEEPEMSIPAGEIPEQGDIIEYEIVEQIILREEVLEMGIPIEEVVEVEIVPVEESLDAYAQLDLLLEGLEKSGIENRGHISRLSASVDKLSQDFETLAKMEKEFDEIERRATVEYWCFIEEMLERFIGAMDPQSKLCEMTTALLSIASKRIDENDRAHGDSQCRKREEEPHETEDVPRVNETSSGDDAENDAEGHLQICFNEDTLEARFPDLDEETRSQLNRYINERVYELQIGLAKNEEHFQRKFSPVLGGDVDSCYLFTYGPK